MVYKRQPLVGFDIKKSFAPLEENGFFVNHSDFPFKSKETEFSFENAWWMAEFSRLSYVNKRTSIRKYLKSAGFSQVKFFEKNGSKAFITYNKDTIIVSFTGTELDQGFDDLLVDLQFWPTKWNKGEGLVHSGFERGFMLIWDEIFKYIKPLMATRSLWFTGHSLGGALATLAASVVEAQGCYTFGCPRVGSKKFRKSIKTPIYRIAKTRDIVTRVPTPPIYRHVGKLFFVKEDGVVIKDPSWLRMFYERLGGSEWKILFFLAKALIFRDFVDIVLNYLHDHSPYNYSVYMWNNINSK